MFAKTTIPKFSRTTPSLLFLHNSFVPQQRKLSLIKTFTFNNNPIGLLSHQRAKHLILSFERYQFGNRFCSTQVSPAQTVAITDKLEEPEGVLTAENPNKDEFSSEPINLAGKEIVAVFNCGVCETKNIRAFSRLSYTKGVVIVRCGGCRKLHLMADNLGWFEDKAVNIETILLKKGQKVTKVTSEQWQDILHKQTAQKQDSSSQHSLNVNTDAEPNTKDS